MCAVGGAPHEEAVPPRGRRAVGTRVRHRHLHRRAPARRGGRRRSRSGGCACVYKFSDYTESSIYLEELRSLQILLLIILRVDGSIVVRSGATMLPLLLTIDLLNQ
jgi:hypothetical protein